MTSQALTTAQAVTTPSRRRVQRSRSLLMAARLETAQVDELCLVLDISPCGAAVRTIAPRSVDEPVRLDFGDSFAAAGTVRWSGDGHCGIEFDDIVDLAPLFVPAGSSASARTAPAREAAGARRTQPRMRRRTQVVLRYGDERQAGELHDVSAVGSRINLATTSGLQRGDRVSFWVEDRFECHGTIRWVTPGAIGVAFDPTLRFWKLEKWLCDKAGQGADGAVEARSAPSAQPAGGPGQSVSTQP